MQPPPCKPLQNGEATAVHPQQGRDRKACCECCRDGYHVVIPVCCVSASLQMQNGLSNSCDYFLQYVGSLYEAEVTVDVLATLF